MVMPPDLKKALAKAPGAAAKFKALTAARQKQFLYFMNDAKKEETRIKRIAHILEGSFPDVPAVRWNLHYGRTRVLPLQAVGRRGRGARLLDHDRVAR